jgi:hypothetical protein
LKYIASQGDLPAPTMSTSNTVLLIFISKLALFKEAHKLAVERAGASCFNHRFKFGDIVRLSAALQLFVL